ncbi:MAG: hypothetical protein U9R27_03285 [Campylobacterota bacterium]|nr:hypothetical protein [Campylobacterota bacterium]
MCSCFVDQIASQEILLRVTNVCGECYDDLEVGDQIFYDMDSYRYLCQRCQEIICDNMEKESEDIDQEVSLF